MYLFFDRIQKINTLPEGFIGESFSAGIKLSNDGRFLYASNRGHNSIATFAIAKDGTLTLINHITSGGIWPRDFTLSPDNKFLIVANQFDNNVVVFKRNEELGTLINTGNKIERGRNIRSNGDKNDKILTLQSIAGRELMIAHQINEAIGGGNTGTM